METVGISQLKTSQRGIVTGHFFPSSRKPVLYDCEDSIEVVIFGDVILKPRSLYQITAEKLILNLCLPVSSSNVKLLSDESEDWKNSPRSKLRSFKSRTPKITGCFTDFRIFVREKCNFTKRDTFHMEVLLWHSTLNKPIKLSICNIESAWFLYVVTGRFYLVEIEKGIVIDDNTALLDVHSSNVGNLCFNECENVSEIMTCPFYKGDVNTMPFYGIKASDNALNQCSFVAVKCVIVSTSSFKTSGLITCVDSNNDVENIGFTPAYKVLPKTIIPGAEIILSHLLVKTVKQKRRFITATKITRIVLLSLPDSHIPSTCTTSSLYDVQVNSKAGLVSLIVSVSCILSLNIDTITNISCKLCVCDSTGTATLHIKDNIPFVEEIFQFTDNDRELLRNAKLDCGKVDFDTREPLQRIFSGVLSVSVIHCI